MNPTEQVKDIYGSFGMSWQDHLKHLVSANGNAAWTLVDGRGTYCGMFGIMLQYRGVGGGSARIWALPSREIYIAEGGVRKLLRTAGMCLNSIVAQWGLHRVDAVVRTDFEEGSRLVMSRYVGLKHVTTLRAFDLNRADYHLYERIFD